MKASLSATDFVIGGEVQIVVRWLFGDMAQSADGGWIAAEVQGFRQRQDGLLGHAVQQIVRFGVEEDRPPDGVGPEVVMGHPAQGGFDPAQDDGAGVLEMAANEVRIGNYRPVGTAVVLPAGSVIV